MDWLLLAFVATGLHHDHDDGRHHHHNDDGHQDDDDDDDWFRKLNTSINHLLLWLCAASLLEATLGILAKCLILGDLSFFSVSLLNSH